MRRIYFATSNPHKFEEIKDLFEELAGIKVEKIEMAVKDFVFPKEVENYFLNSLNKALKGALLSGYICLGEDSGLEIEAFDGKPGPLSRRFGGENLSYRERMEKILKEMENVENRKARFVCFMVLANERGAYVPGRGIVEGEISRKITGMNGFGYDPIFHYPLLGKTFGEMERQEKNRVSHRRRAIEELLKKISYLF